ncbi:resolvase-like serine recombinase [Citrifermentans bemidjiense Bem]|uniref:Resolvase-like serine recombinase n=1 Tax=Citrifermentans bemidjiense (strain ATCC BAA-1014 / DSM 16622 / JCM 12645 / Bem) TaxID=404380 RepID=B5E834_CITBB|nr:recombinase family protein [Citrifermentans bemidjiense]ACH40003.1 resolvase-like serine recombinase [Citrifermentans bemidjiense Bem]
MTPKLYIAYYRVSTDKQGERGLGIQAQRDAVTRFIERQEGAVLYACFTEVESGTKKGNRPGLADALALVRKVKGTLLIAKLDRLARNVRFIATLMEENPDFIALDFPESQPVILHVMASFAEHEARVIAARTSAAIQARLKDPDYRNSKGARWGNPQCLNPKYKSLSKSEAAAARRKDAVDFAKKLEPIIKFYLQDR